MKERREYEKKNIPTTQCHHFSKYFPFVNEVALLFFFPLHLTVETFSMESQKIPLQLCKKKVLYLQQV